MQSSDLSAEHTVRTHYSLFARRFSGVLLLKWRHFSSAAQLSLPIAHVQELTGM
jgi:hypothetical protein